MWNNPAVIEWSGFLLDSFRVAAGRELIERYSPRVDAQELFIMARVVVSHGLGADPIFNYANRAAQGLWNLDWARFTTMPSRLSAEPVDQAVREQMLAQVVQVGYVSDYRGVRVTTTGRRFEFSGAEVWNVQNAQGERVGLAATFVSWTFL